MSGERDYGRELYPFLYAGGAPDESRTAAVLAEVRASTIQKCRDVVALRRQLGEEYEGQLVDAATAMAARFTRGGTLLACGNGGSATDAQDAATDCLRPPRAGWRPLPGLSLTGDSAIITAVGNDVGFENIFRRQIIAVGGANDIVLGFSTSGNSANVLAAFDEGHRRGMLTVALAGDAGGAMAASEAVDFCFVARTDYIPRIQEGHATVWHILLDLVHTLLARTPA